jgi:hypothetical protein
MAFHIPVQPGQEWLYALLEQQKHDIGTIKGWVIFFGIVAVASVILTACNAILAVGR